MQSVKHLDFLRQFWVVLLCDDGNSGVDFTDLPDVHIRKGKGSITDNSELSPYFGCGFLIKHGN